VEKQTCCVDEVGTSTVQKTGGGGQFYSGGQKQVGALISWEVGRNLTAMC
jgi:hypothetical protein